MLADRFRSFLIILLPFISVLSLSSQTPTLSIKYFSREDGIYSSFVNSVAQDSTGFIWIATRDGLYRYDGTIFTSYQSIQDDSTSIPGNAVNYLFVDAKGVLWIATSLGICQYNEKRDEFLQLANLRNPAGLDGINVHKIAGDPAGNIIVTNGQSLYRFEAGSRTFKSIITLDSGLINDFIFENNTTVLLACTEEKGLIRGNLTTGNTNPVPVTGKQPDILSTLHISALELIGDQLLISTIGGGVKKLDLKTDILIQIPYNNQDDANVTDIVKDQTGKLWTIDYTGLKYLDQSTWVLQGYYPESPHSKGIRPNLKGIFQDRQENYWIFHQPGGIGLSTVPKGFSYFNNDPLEYWRTSRANIISVNEDVYGNLWMGFYEGGIDVFDWQKGTVIRYQYNDKDPHSLGRGSVLCIFRDSKGIMWAGTYFDGLQYFDPEKKQFVHLKHNPGDTTSIAGNDIRSITEDQDGNLWLAVHSKGVDRYDRETGRFEHFNRAKNGLSNNWPFHVYIDKQGNLWVGAAWGLNLLKKGTSRFLNFTSVINDSSTISNNEISSIYQDDSLNIWIGTSSGLNRYNPAKNNFTRFPVPFNNVNIASILNDKDGFLWLGTSSGIFRFHPATGAVNHFSTADGLISMEFNPRAAYRNGQDGLFFGGTRGIDLFNPHTIFYNTIPPPVLIDKIKVLNRELTIHNSNKLSQHIRYTKEIRLPYTDNFITFSFVALNYINPQTNQYAYFLEGFEKNWHYIGNSREATYTNLDPGKYIFRVIASNNDGVWNSTGAALSIEILPPWYKTLLFKIFLLITALSLVYGYITLRTSTLETQKHRLEKAVEEKTAELSEKNDLLKRHAWYLDENNRLLLERQNQLEQQSEELKNQSESLESANLELQKLIKTRDKIFSVIAHDLSSPFMSILGFSEMLLSRYNSLSDAEKLQYISTINNSSERLHTLLQNLLLWAQSQTRGISYHPTLLPLKSIITEVIELRKESLNSKKINLQINFIEDITVWADREMIKTIFRNLLSNAIKFTVQEGMIRFEAVNTGEMVQISLTNTGTVISRDKIARILSSDSIQSEPGTDGESGSGLGLILCKDFIRRNKGKLDISSDAVNGTRFIVSLPLQP
ncbi:MAG: two-component regulator propeller domain-containing protein [Bacteroidales bacterium]